ncbi:MAG: PTS sugar transporter subunit IIA [Desulfatibacillaceae bacterium]
MKITAEQAASFLRVPVTTVERWVRQGSIPVRRRGGRILFEKEDLENWARDRKLLVDRQPAAGTPASAPENTSLSAAITQGGVHYGIKGGDMGAVLADMTRRLEYPPEYREELLVRLLEREEMSSTGIGKGVAMPHPRAPVAGTEERAAIVTFFPDTPLDWNAIDDQPVFVLFLLLSPTIRAHLNMLSRLAFCLRDDTFVEFLRSGPWVEELSKEVSLREAGMEGRV